MAAELDAAELEARPRGARVQFGVSTVAKFDARCPARCLSRCEGGGARERAGPKWPSQVSTGHNRGRRRGPQDNS
eukprot:12367816-Alexandrium_andersonii.AAC.1